ncbi:MAG: hypothetical protein U0797_15380 [Gemmataceae bacterium]
MTQLESPAMRHLLTQMGVRGLDDVVQALALVRPGAASAGMKDRFVRRRRGLEAFEIEDPAPQRLLGETEGIMLYEDDSLRADPGADRNAGAGRRPLPQARQQAQDGARGGGATRSSCWVRGEPHEVSGPGERPLTSRGSPGPGRSPSCGPSW